MSPNHRPAADVTFVLVGELSGSLREMARQRGLTLNELVNRLLRAIAEDDLVDAILDGDER